jgi:Flp pilus assembly CpaE family ATPase
VLDALAALETCPPLVVSGPSDDAGLILRALDLGARHFFPGEPSSDDLERTLGRLVTDSAEAASRPAAPIIAVMGAKGGVGASFVACQLAVSLQAQGARTAVVDLNLPLGDVALYFDLRPRYTLAHVARDAEQLDAAYLRGALVQHHSGVSVLAAPARLDEAMLIKADHVDRVLRLLAADFDYVVVDVSREWKETSIRALDAASQVLLVTLSDVATLSQARKHLELLRRLGQPEQALHLVTNRDTASGHLSDDDYLGFLGRAPEARIPNDFASTLLSVNEGRPVGEIAPRGSLQLAYDALARQLATWCGRSLGPEPEPEPTPVPPTPPSRPLRSVGVAPAALCSASPRPTGWDESPRAFQVLTVASNKGGVGKTTIATNLAVFLRALREDLPILVLEFDDQTMPDRMFAIDSSSGAPDVAAALRSGSLADAVRLGQYGVHYVPSSPDMSALKREIEDPFYLQSVLLRSGWQGLVIIDTKSDLEILTQNAIAASDLSIVVVHDLASLQQAEKLYGLLDRWGVSRERARVLLSLVDRRIKYTEGEDVLGFLISRIRALGLPLFEAFLSRSHRIEALYTNPEGRAHSILHGAPNSLVHRQMRHLAQDVIQLLETQRQQPKRVVPETPAAPATVPTPAALPLPAAADPRSATPRRWLEYASGARSWARSRLGGAS